MQIKDNQTMRKAIKLLALLAIGAALTLTACGKDEDERHSPVVPDEPTPDVPDDPTPDTPDDTVALWVDLGLPSGLLWATCNLGADSLGGFGDYFAWGDTATHEVYNWSTYPHSTVDDGGALSTLTKYNTRPAWGTVDNLTTLAPDDDAAAARLGDGARIPSREEWEELIANTTSELMTLDGVIGRKLTSKTNGNSLFLPAAGERNGADFKGVGLYGIYWSSSLNMGNPKEAWYFAFNASNQATSSYGRCIGLSVRAVRIAR